jgi:hypothetical protein
MQMRRYGINAPAPVSGITIKYVWIYKVGNRQDPGFGGAGKCMSNQAFGGDGIYINGCENCEIAYSRLDFINRDGIFFLDSNGSTWGLNSIHHNYINHASDDSITALGFTDVYNNDIYDNYNNFQKYDYDDNEVGRYNGWGRTYLPGNCDEGHPDNIQTNGIYMRVYNNLFQNFIQGMQVTKCGCNYAGPMWIYNNVYRITKPSGGSPGYNGTGISITERNQTSYDNIHILNNTFVDIGFRAIRWLQDNNSGPITNSSFKNNIVYNTPYNGYSGTPIEFMNGAYDSTDLVVDYNLISPGAAGGNKIGFKGTDYTHSSFASANLGQMCGGSECSVSAPTFLNYQAFDGTNDFHLISASAGIDSGESLSYFNTDKDDFPRGFLWDVGAFEARLDIVSPSPPQALRIQ